MNQPAAGAIARQDRRTRMAAPQRIRLAVEPQSIQLLRFAVAGKTGLEQRLDVGPEINFSGGGGWQALGGRNGGQ
jgi:hypothetical protein